MTPFANRWATRCGTFMSINMRVLVVPLLAVCVLALPNRAFGERADLDGVWLLVTAATAPDPVPLTPAGEQALANYDPLRDDSDLQCIPVSFTNIMHTPSPPFEIKQRRGYVEINYEFMDVRRRVPLDKDLVFQTAPHTVPDHPHMGRSIGRYDGETLVIDTVELEDGVLDTFQIVGLPQSRQMRIEERFNADGDTLAVVVTHYDPVNYTVPLVVTYEFHRLDSEILEWGCTPEAADYEERIRSTD